MKKEKYGVVRIDDVNAIYTGHLFSVIGEEDEILENGMVGLAGDFRTTDKTIEREVRSLEKPKDNKEPIVLVAHPEINYEECRTTDKALENFYIPAGVPARAYALEKSDVFSVSKKMVKALDTKAGAKVGNYVVPQAGERILEEVAEKPEGAFIGKVIRRDVLGTTTVIGAAGAVKQPIELVVIEVLKNTL